MSAQVFGAYVLRHYYQAACRDADEARGAILEQARASGDTHKRVRTTAGEKLIELTRADVRTFRVA